MFATISNSKKRVFSAVLCSVLLMLMAGCGKSNERLGHWKINIDETLKKTFPQGASHTYKDAMHLAYEHASIEMTENNIIIRMPDIGDGSVIQAYTIISVDKGCYKLNVENYNGSVSWCFSGDRLSIHDSGTKIILVLDRY